MQIVINGHHKEIVSTTLSTLCNELNIKPDNISVQLNGNILKKSDFDSQQLTENDSVEIIRFIGGGQK